MNRKSFNLVIAFIVKSLLSVISIPQNDCNKFTSIFTPDQKSNIILEFINRTSRGDNYIPKFLRITLKRFDAGAVNYFYTMILQSIVIVVPAVGRRQRIYEFDLRSFYEN